MADDRTSWQARTDGTVWRAVGDEVVIMDLAPGVYYSLRGVGGAIWQLLVAQPCTEAEIVTALADEFDVTLATLQADVRRFLTELQSSALVVKTP